MSLRKRGGIWWIDIRAPNDGDMDEVAALVAGACASAYQDLFDKDALACHVGRPPVWSGPLACHLAIRGEILGYLLSAT